MFFPHGHQKGDQYETKDEKEALEYYKMMKSGRPTAGPEDSGEEEELEG